MQPMVSYSLRGNMAVVTLDTPGEKVNILSDQFLKELQEVALRLADDERVKGCVVHSAKKAGFIAGADIGAISSVSDPATGTRLAKEGQNVFNLWSKLPFPVVAAVHGHCIGGGTEFTLACRARIASADAHFSLPEVKLGIFPGFGGTQRLPRLIGLESALDLVLSGRNVRASEAHRIGLIDRICAEDLLAEALSLARQLAENTGGAARGKPSAGKHLRQLFLEGNPLGRLLLFQRTRSHLKVRTKGHYPAPYKALELIRQSTTLPLEKGLDLEAQEIGPLLASGICKNLVHVFSLSQRPKKDGTQAGQTLKIRRAAVLGAGIMGGGIAHLLISKDIPVVLRDIRQDAVEGALAHVRKLLQGKERKIRAEDERRLKLITATTQLWGIEEADLVIEAVSEKMELKKSVLREAASQMSDGAIFATNTSALSVTELQDAAERPEQVGGLHFFNPVHRMPLVEIVRAPLTADRTVRTLFALALHLGKIPIEVRDSPGFLVNRLLGAYLNEAAMLVEEGVEWHALDRLMEEFGFPMGPFRLLDEIGIDIASEVATTLSTSFPYLPASALFNAVQSLGLIGKKGGAGLYLYKDNKCTGPNPEIGEKLALKQNRRPGVRERRRLLYLMVNEAGRCIQEGIVAGAEEVDTGMIFGAGFPPFRGGLCRWADRIGIAEIRGGLVEMARGGRERFSPCEYLLERESFYG